LIEVTSKVFSCATSVAARRSEPKAKRIQPPAA
jgi:hypothetical protein